MMYFSNAMVVFGLLVWSAAGQFTTTENPDNSFAVLGPAVTEVNGQISNKYTFVGLFKNGLSPFNQNRLQFAIDNFMKNPAAISGQDRQISFKQPSFTENAMNLDFTIIGPSLSQEERDRMTEVIRTDANAQRAREDVVETQRQDAARGQYNQNRNVGLLVGLLGRK